ncbi:MAG: YaiI/YqxD family protein [Pseudomonadota bacterium]
MPQIYVDADACPVKDEVVKVAIRHDFPVTFVSNAFMRLPEDRLVTRRIVPEGPDAADDWIAEEVAASDIVVTNDIPLADRCLKKGALVISGTGRDFTEANIGSALASRAISQHLREIGEMTGGPKGFSAKDRSAFLQAMERACRRAKREAGG